jgi:hypothetical protein
MGEMREHSDAPRSGSRILYSGYPKERQPHDGDGQEHQLCIVTMIGGMEIMGDLVTGENNGEPMVALKCPCTLEMQPPATLTLHDSTVGQNGGGSSSSR